jgi:predicted dehydrogenase
VRWTETRNMEAVLQLLAAGKLDVRSLITHRFPVDDARAAYDVITGKREERFLGVIFTYADDSASVQRIELSPAKTVTSAASAKDSVRVGVLGAGAFANAVLLPAIQKERETEFVGACSATGAHSQQAANKFGFRYSTTDEQQLITDDSVNTVVIATRHHLHARQVRAALAAGKHVFCEKPLCLTESELAEIARAYHVNQQSRLMVGFNRRFAPMTVRLKSFLQEINEPLAMHYRVNAGYIPPDHWLNDPEVGGGRLLGEACHFIDFLSFLADTPPVEVEMHALAAGGQYSGDNLVVSLRFANGAHGTVSYLANGDKSFSKERVEVFGGGAVAVLEDFRRLELVRGGRREVVRSRFRQDKGHCNEWAAFSESIRTGRPSPIPFHEIVASTLATLRALESRSSGRAEPVDVSAFLNTHGASGADS